MIRILRTTFGPPRHRILESLQSTATYAKETIFVGCHTDPGVAEQYPARIYLIDRGLVEPIDVNAIMALSTAMREDIDGWIILGDREVMPTSVDFIRWYKEWLESPSECIAAKVISIVEGEVQTEEDAPWVPIVLKYRQSWDLKMDNGVLEIPSSAIDVQYCPWPVRNIIGFGIGPKPDMTVKEYEECRYTSIAVKNMENLRS
jgi:hypothetical protein